MITSFQGEYRWLSNFWPANVQWHFKCPTVEHAYQSAKAEYDKDAIKIAKARTPGEAKRLAKTIVIRQDWDNIKLEVMENLLRQKFSKGSLLAKQLLATGHQEIIEGNTWNDRFWGVCKGSGENNLGKLIMKIRNELRKLD